jgi:hypothetical protein
LEGGTSIVPKEHFMANNWKDLLTQYHGTIRQAAEIVRKHPRASKFRGYDEWSDLENKVGHVRQLYVKGKIPHIAVHEKDLQIFQKLSENLERSRIHFEGLETEDDALDQALANLNLNSMILLDTGPHGPIEGRPDWANESPSTHGPTEGRPQGGVSTHGSDEGRPDSSSGGTKRGAS